MPKGWSKERARQIDCDGRWTIKRSRRTGPAEGGVQHQAEAEITGPKFGCKNHLGIDRAHGFIRRFIVTHLARHDGSQHGALLGPTSTGVVVGAHLAPIASGWRG